MSSQKVRKLKLLNAIAQPVETHVHGFIRRGAIVLLTTPSAAFCPFGRALEAGGGPFQLEYAGRGLLRGN